MGGASAARVLAFQSSGESAWGTTGAATKKLHGITDVSLTIVEKVEAVPTVGNYGPGPVAAEVAQSGEGQIEGIVLYEDSVNILNGLFTAIINSVTTSGAPYTYAYTAPVNSTQVCYSYTLEWGTTGQSYTAPGSVINGINIKGEAGGLWTYSAPVIAKLIKSVTPTTAAWVDRTVNPVRMADTTLYVDGSTGTIGTTAISATLINFEMALNAGRHTKQFAGSINPASWGDAQMEGTLRTLLEFGSTAKAYVDELLGSTGAAVRRQIRINATEGTSAAVKAFGIDFAGIIGENIKLWDDRDGNMTVDLTWKGQYSTQLANWLKFNLQNGSSSTT